MEIAKYRIELEMEEYLSLKKLVENSKINISLYEKIQNPTTIHYSPRKVKAMAKATEKRSELAREKIQNAINLLRLENKEITTYSISKIGKVGFQTVQKYLGEDEIKSLNKKV